MVASSSFSTSSSVGFRFLHFLNLFIGSWRIEFFLAFLRNFILRRSFGDGRFWGSLFKQLATNCLKSWIFFDSGICGWVLPRLKSPLSSGAASFGMLISAFIGCWSDFGGSPLASSMAVIPRIGFSKKSKRIQVTKGPNIGLIIIRRLFNNFRRHPKRRSNKSISFERSFWNLRGDTEIGKFDVTRLCEQDVCCFYISANTSKFTDWGLCSPVNFSLFWVEIIKRFADFAEDHCDVNFVEFAHWEKVWKW